ncbi:D-alanyl-D-alanine carboxypeptidase family protein [Alkalibacterium putridalgicola]|uniref:M15 family metallopeptidase n=1 Tax=Alkalibacterium putridalgicola TaxID=426703 RepID=UPI0034CE3CFD
MLMKKWLLTTGTLMTLMILGACAQTEEDPANEPGQAEVDQSEDTLSDEKENQPEESNDETENPSNEDNGNPETEEDVEETNETDSGDTGKANKDEEEQTDVSENEGPKLDLEEDILNPDSLAVLVNKKYSLPEDYVPENLVTVEVPTVLPNPEIKQMREAAADALKEMFDAAEEEGVILHARSGYRSYNTQVQLFRNYASNHGEEAANKYSARAGESEHQTGLVMDVTSESVNLQITSDFGETEEGKWVKENAHEYGFIIRYPKGKSDITGYVYEPWHLRYLGEELATDVYASGLTYEEYLVERGLDIEIQ